jgi:hypothetical protein
MFVGDEMRAAISAAAAAARLDGLASDTSLTRASYAAWRAGMAVTGPAAGIPELVAVQSRGPVRRGAVSVLALRWEAADAGGRLFPVLDANITVIPDGEQATLIGLEGVYRTLPGTGLDPVIARQAATATIRALLGRIAGAITDPAAHGGKRVSAGRGRARGAARLAVLGPGRPGPPARPGPAGPPGRCVPRRHRARGTPPGRPGRPRWSGRRRG